MNDPRSGLPDGWTSLLPGAALTVAKYNPAGELVTIYPGSVLAHTGPPEWCKISATWTRPRIELDGLAFVPGDLLIEYFSARHWFNLFAVHAPGGGLRGWYGNVTRPTTLDKPLTLCWHDLYVDVIALPGGTIVVRDEDELIQSGLPVSDPSLTRMIYDARDELLDLLTAGKFPYSR